MVVFREFQDLVRTMRTTLNIDEQLLNMAKHRAVEQGISLSKVVENLMRQSLVRPESERQRVRLITTGGSGVKPGVDLDSSSSLLDIMEDPE